MDARTMLCRLQELRWLIVMLLVIQWTFAQTTSTVSESFRLTPPEKKIEIVIKIMEPIASKGGQYVVGDEESIVRGVVSPAAAVKSVTVNNAAAIFSADGSFNARVRLTSGSNTVLVVAATHKGQKIESALPFVYDANPPTVEILEPKLAAMRGIVNVEEDVIILRGKAFDDAGIAHLAVNGQLMQLGADSSFTQTIPLADGETAVIVEALDKSGKRTERELRLGHLKREKLPPYITGKRYALIVGIDKYRGKWAQLKNAVRDAKALEENLRRDFSFGKITTLYDEQATRERIITTFEDLVRTLKPEDNLFVYYSGHGEFEKQLNKGYWIPVNAVERSTSQYISNSDIQTLIGGMPAKHVLLVTDACFAGDLFRGSAEMLPYENTPNYFKNIAQRKSRKALTSGGLEPVMDGGAEGHSVFAYYLLKALTTTEGRFFDTYQLFDKLRIPVANNSEQIPELQAIKNTGDEGGQFVFVRK